MLSSFENGILISLAIYQGVLQSNVPYNFMNLTTAIKKIITGINNRSIREKFFFFHLVLAIGPLLLLGIVLFLQSYAVQEMQAVELLSEVSERAALNVENYFRMLENELSHVISTTDIMSLERRAQAGIINRLFLYENKRHKGVFKEFVLLDNKGGELARVPRVNRHLNDDRENRFFKTEFRTPMKYGTVSYGRIIRDKVTGEPFVTIALPLMSAQSESANGVLGGKISLKFAWKLLEGINIGKSGCVYLLDENGTVVALKDPSMAPKTVRFQLPAKAGIYRGLAGNKVVLAFRMVKLGSRRLYVVTERPVYEALHFTLRIMSVVGVFFVIALAGAIVLGAVVRKKIAYPIESLAGAALAISEGDLTRRANFFSNDEMGVLATSFNAMTEKLLMTIDFYRKSIAARDAANEELEEKTAKLQTVNRNLSIEVADRKKAELAVMESEARKSAILKAFDGFLYVCSSGYRIEFMNENLIEHIGHDATGELCFKTMYDLDSICPWCSNEHVLKGETVRWEMQSPKDNRWYYIVNSPIFHPGGRISKQAMIMDITDRKIAEKELMNAKKLESVAMLAAGIAHEINNPLTNASLNIEILKKRLLADVRDHDFLKKMECIDRSVGRASMIAKELLHFCRKRDLEFKTVNICDLMDAVLSLVEHKIGKIRVHRNVSKEHAVSGDFVRLEQVFINIINNSVDAMPEGGDIFIESAVSGASVEIAVTDTGIGISEQHLQRIFDPFFTTKEVGFGTGLGLSICYEIVRHHNGTITISNTAGKGATVVVRLPLTGAHEEDTDS